MHCFTYVFSLYLDNCSSNNSSSLHVKYISENREADLNELPTIFYQDRELINYHSSRINEHELNIPCFDTLNDIEGNSNECHEVIDDNYFDIEDIDLSSLQLNPYD